MFTGLIQQTGELRERALHGAAGKLLVRAERGLENPKPGESIAVNGACLTLEKAEGPLLWFHVMQETFEKTNLGILAPGSILNLERALSLGDRLGGHLVSGLHFWGTFSVRSAVSDAFQQQSRLAIAVSLQIEELNMIFKACGTPSDDEMRQLMQ